jgi:hypothetical protein
MTGEQQLADAFWQMNRAVLKINEILDRNPALAENLPITPPRMPMKSPQNANSWLNIMKSGLADNWSEQGVNAVCKNGDPSEVYREGKSNCGRWPDLMQRCFNDLVVATDSVRHEFAPSLLAAQTTSLATAPPAPSPVRLAA